MESTPLDDLQQLNDNFDSRLEVAGFWLRVFALLIDSAVIFALFIMSLFAFFLLILIGYGGDTSANSEATRLVDWINENVVVYVFYLFGYLYFVYMESSPRQATFGKYWLGLRVVDMNGQRISLQTAMSRRLATIASFALLYIGILMIIFTQKKQALHDKIAQTLVIRAL